ncbi:MAG: polysaccharide pyruvyl transferase family protein [Lachnospiraceae bacterium]|nr:polysaccharide pyruvyl transferase family protein [Lachnospiraceae bacterium]
MYDVGIYGLWYGRNYGSIMTYFALSAVVRDMGYSVVMVENPLAGGNKREADFPPAHPYHFSREQYDITEHYPLHEMEKLNDWCDTFLIGSDQMWNYTLSKAYGQSYFLDFVNDVHARVAYAASFGRMRYAAPSEYKRNVGENLKRFREISVRDDFSKRILEDEFGIEAKKGS